MKLDSHFHVGTIFGGRNEDKFAAPAKVAAFLQANNITHGVACYGERASMEELEALTPEITYYKLQWITGYDTPIDYGYADGLKLHSHRGRDPHKSKSKGSEAEFTFGVHQEEEYPYSFSGMDYTSRKLKQLLKTLPPNFILEYHTQGTESLVNVSRAASIAHLAFLFPHLKHIIVHGGTYGAKSFYPAGGQRDKWYFRAVMHEAGVKEAIHLVNLFDNLYLDTSILLSPKHFKTPIFQQTQKAGFGSDYPFGEQTPAGPVLKAEKAIQRAYGWDQAEIDAVHTRMIEWLETPLAVTTN